MTLADAIAADREVRIVDAAEAYERVLASDPNDPEATLGLAILYWEASDFGVSTALQLPPPFVAHAGVRLGELLAVARERFGDRPDVQFWTKYIPWAVMAEPFEPSECRRLMRDHPEYLEPAMVLFADSHGTEARAEAMKLAEWCAVDRTARCRYITSVIEGVLTRIGARRERGA